MKAQDKATLLDGERDAWSSMEERRGYNETEKHTHTHTRYYGFGYKIRTHCPMLHLLCSILLILMKALLKELQGR